MIVYKVANGYIIETDHCKYVALDIEQVQALIGDLFKEESK